MILLTKRMRAMCVITFLLIPFSASATNGYFLIGFGAKSRGMGGVGVAYAQDGLAAAFNPAGMSDVEIKGAMRIDAGIEFFNPPRAVRQDSATLESGFPGSTGGINHESGSNEFLIPSMGMIYKFNRKISMGFAAIGAGANTRYDQTVPGKPACVNNDLSDGSGSTLFNVNCQADSPTAGVQLLQMQMLPSFSYKVNRNHAIGASLAIAVQQFRAYGLGAFDEGVFNFTAEGGKVSNNGNDYSYGAGIRLGWLGKFADKKLRIGANYASRVYMSEFDEYTSLFAEQGDFDIPEHFALGISYKFTDKLTAAFDVQHILYSDIASVGNKGPYVEDPGDMNINGTCAGVADTVDPQNCKLGGNDGMGFGWHDATAYKIGVNYDYSNKWSVRAGWNYGKTPIQEDQVLFNMLAPATVEHHVTLGASYRPNKNMEWSVNFTHAFSNTIKGPSAFGPTGDPAVDQNIDSVALDMEINTFGVSFAYNM